MSEGIALDGSGAVAPSARVRETLRGLIDISGISLRAIERSLASRGCGVDLTRLLAGRFAMKVHQLIEVLQVLDVHPVEFFQVVFGEPERRSPVLRRADALCGRSRRPPASARAEARAVTGRAQQIAAAIGLTIPDSVRLGEINWRSFDYHPELGRVRLYVEEHYREGVTVLCAAEIAGTTARSFAAFFRKKVGIRYSHWVRWVRISHAIQVMCSGSEPIAEVARAVGYRAPRTFQRSFRRVTNLTAREFRRRVRPDPAPGRAVRIEGAAPDRGASGSGRPSPADHRSR